jgi:hypothetical protein
MLAKLAQSLMDEFAVATGILGPAAPRRYLWTDAFAVCNCLGLARQTGDARYLKLARDLVDQVHHVLGRHRADDPRRGWISGLTEEEGEQHPTCRGLRIGKPLNERGPRQPLDARREWDRDGQYFHYLTKWMHALHRMGRETGELCYRRWAVELAVRAHRAFTHQPLPGGPQALVWKMSIDLSRPLVSSTGQHDPLDGLITCLELQTAGSGGGADEVELAASIADFSKMCAPARWATDDPLGIGGLLDDAARLAQLACGHNVQHQDLLHRLLTEAELSLQCVGRSDFTRRAAEHRLAFRELGLSIGLHALQVISDHVGRDRGLAALAHRLLRFRPLADQIESFWSDAAHRISRSWLEHHDINAVMLATSLAPASYLQV